MDQTIPTLLQVVPQLVTGGVERNAVDLARALQQRGYKSYIASTLGPLTEPSFVHLPGPFHRKDPLSLMANTQRLKTMIQQHHINIVHVRSRAPAWSCLPLKKTVPVVTTYHGFYNATNPLKHFYNSVMVRGDKVIAISQFIQQHIQQVHQVDPAKIALIPEGVDVDQFQPTLGNRQALRQAWGFSDQEVLILLPGRLTGWKGQNVLLQALTQLPPLMRVVLLGSTRGKEGYRQDLENFAAQHGIRDRVCFIEQHEPMAEAYAAADLVVSASTDPEAFGRVSAEACAMRKLVIGTDHGATPEILKDHGFLVPPGNAMYMAETLIQAWELTTDEKLKRGETARQHIITNFSLAQMYEKTLALYRELIKCRMI